MSDLIKIYVISISNIDDSFVVKEVEVSEKPKTYTDGSFYFRKSEMNKVTNNRVTNFYKVFTDDKNKIQGLKSELLSKTFENLERKRNNIESSYQKMKRFKENFESGEV